MNTRNQLFFPVLIATTALLGSCKQANKNSKETATNGTDSINTVFVSMDTISNKKTLRIDTFSKSPETDSCSCLFSVDSSLLISKHYIFAYDLAVTAFMKINGVMTKFTQTEYTSAGDNTLIYFSSGAYQMILEAANSTEAGKEKTIQSGSIRVTDKENNAFITTYYGVCGCFKKPK